MPMIPRHRDIRRKVPPQKVFDRRKRTRDLRPKLVAIALEQVEMHPGTSIKKFAERLDLDYDYLQYAFLECEANGSLHRTGIGRVTKWWLGPLPSSKTTEEIGDENPRNRNT